MNITENNKKLILDEFEYVLESIAITESMEEKLYLLSALHGVVNRVMNIEFDSDLIFLHHVLSATHAAFTGRYDAMKNKKAFPLQITKEIFDKLFLLIGKLYDCLKNNTEINEISKGLIVLAYTTTGNGFYLYQKGMLKI